MINKNWDGEGFPRVGQMVQTTSFGECEFIATGLGETGCFRIKKSGNLILIPYYHAIPIKTPKQVARDKVIAEMVKTAYTTENGTITGKLYDAGFRKVKPLPADWYADCLDGDMTLNNYLIENDYCIGEATKNLTPPHVKHKFVNAGNMMVDKHGTSYLMYEGEVKVYKTDKNGNYIWQEN